MRSHCSPIRKAAIVIASLDDATAEMLLEQMPPEQAEAVRDELEEMSDIDPEEQEAIIEEFFRIGPLIPEHEPPGLELNDTLAGQFKTPMGRSNPLPLASTHKTAGSEAFQCLQDAEPEMLVPFLEREHPQAVALVIAHLPPARAGHILARLPASIQADVIRRMVELEATDPQVVRDVERAVESWLEKQQPEQQQTAGLAAVSAILNSADGVARRQILSNLAVHDRGLAHKFSHQTNGQRRITFAELCNFDADSLTRVVRAADSNTALLALIGAPPDLVDRLLGCLPKEDARWLAKELQQLGPARLADIDHAQEALADLANHMLADGRLPGLDCVHLTAVA